MKVIFTGGKARKNNNITRDWNSFESGVMILYDFEKECIVDKFEYVTPIENKASEKASVLFKACHLDGDLLYIPTKTEVLAYNLRRKDVVRSFSHPLMNDLHHVLVHDDFIYVVSTGLDSVLIFDIDSFKLKDVFFVGDGRFEDRFDLNIDYRKIESLKPHECHPNYVFYYSGNIYVTRLQQRDCMRISDRKVFHIADNFIHDGVYFGGRLYFTSVDGKLITTNLAGVTELLDLSQIQSAAWPLGWCRGVMPIDTENVLIGFSVLRNTKFKENIKWAVSKIKHNFNYTENRTRISFCNIIKKIITREFYLDELGMDAVFGIVPVHKYPY